MTRVYAACSGSGTSSKNISGLWFKRSFGGLPARGVSGVGVNGQASPSSAGAGKWEGKTTARCRYERPQMAHEPREDGQLLQGERR